MTLQQEIIQALGAKPQIDVAGEIRRSVDFLKSYLQTYPFIKSLVLGISGGQDSTLTGKLCQIAINELRAETGDSSLQFIAVRLPYGVQADEQDCQDAIAFIQPDRVLTVNIKAAVLASEQALREAGIELSDFVRGNEKARERMKAQYSIAGMTKGVVVGTDHNSFGHSGDAVLGLHSLTGFFISANEVAQFDACFAQRLFAGQHRSFNIDCQHPVRLDKCDGVLAVLLISLHAIG